MWMLDTDKRHSVKNLKLFLTVAEAEFLVKNLNRLLIAPDEDNYALIPSKDRSRQINFSILTRKKLDDFSRFSKLEQRVLEED